MLVLSTSNSSIPSFESYISYIFFIVFDQSLNNVCTSKNSGDEIDHHSSNIFFLELNVCSMTMIDTKQARITFATMKRMKKI